MTATSITTKEIEKLASLARIDVPESEQEKLAEDISSIISYVEQIREISTGEEKTLPRQRNVFREDINAHEGGLHTEELLNEAPATEGGYFKVKKILGESNGS
jgi:aspartyl-tRNA(Asn)/glutamyl-tRNA(Gln) amidotransferase subunit C